MSPLSCSREEQSLCERERERERGKGNRGERDRQREAWISTSGLGLVFVSSPCPVLFLYAADEVKILLGDFSLSPPWL